MKWLMENLLQRRAERLVRFVVPDLPGFGSILDVGSGTGHNAEYLTRTTPLEVVEADVVDIHLVGRGPVLFDGVLLPFRDAAFPASILLFVLQYSQDPVVLLRELRRVTSGRVIVLQSTYSGTIGRWILSTREFVTGRFAFYVVRALGLLTARTSALQPKQYFTRQSLDDIWDASGFRVRVVRRFDAISSCVSRELYVLEPIAPCP